MSGNYSCSEERAENSNDPLELEWMANNCSGLLGRYDSPKNYTDYERFTNIRKLVASNKNTNIKTIEYLSEDVEEDVLRAVILNDKTPKNIRMTALSNLENNIISYYNEEYNEE